MKRPFITILLIVIGLFIYSKLKMSTSNPEILLPLIAEVELNIKNRDHKNTAISQVDVAWQLDHILKVINRVSDTLLQSKPADYKTNINAGRVFTLTGGYIPRGFAQSPDVVRPPDEILTEDLHNQIKEARAYVRQLILLPKKANFKHFAFGQMDKGQTIRFLEVHTKHHLKIVKDILK